MENAGIPWWQDAIPAHEVADQVRGSLGGLLTAFLTETEPRDLVEITQTMAIIPAPMVAPLRAAAACLRVLIDAGMDRLAIQAWFSGYDRQIGAIPAGLIRGLKASETQLTSRLVAAAQAAASGSRSGSGPR